MRENLIIPPEKPGWYCWNKPRFRIHEARFKANTKPEKGKDCAVFAQEKGTVFEKSS
jgi:hypothetical protein